MKNYAAFFEAFAWNQVTGQYDIWLGTATRAAIAKLGPRARPEGLVGYESAAKFPDGWACRSKH
jgi:hypothetical protein